jgi:hypothetical protein
VAAARAARLGTNRPATRLTLTQGQTAAEALRRTAGADGIAFALAGPSAVHEGDRLLGHPEYVYWDAPPAALSDVTRAARPGERTDLVLYPPDERPCLWSPRIIGGLPHTGEVITWLDLAISPDPRVRALADALRPDWRTPS